MQTSHVLDCIDRGQGAVRYPVATSNMVGSSRVATVPVGHVTYSS
ncbi:MAG: hypothetical protein ACM3O9_09640 [Methylocystaceae bacterium]